MPPKRAIRVEADSLSRSERERLLDEIADTADCDVTVVTDDEEIEAVGRTLAGAPDAQGPALDDGPRFADGTDPQLIVLVLETVILVLETGVVTAELYKLHKQRDQLDSALELVEESEAVRAKLDDRESGDS